MQWRSAPVTAGLVDGTGTIGVGTTVVGAVVGAEGDGGLVTRVGGVVGESTMCTSDRSGGRTISHTAVAAATAPTTAPIRAAARRRRRTRERDGDGHERGVGVSGRQAVDGAAEEGRQVVIGLRHRSPSFATSSSRRNRSRPAWRWNLTAPSDNPISSATSRTGRPST